MLNEVNELIETELKDVNDQTTFEEITLNYYAKLLVAYKVYDIPTRTIILILIIFKIQYYYH